jgi:hypothetical protein
MWFLPRVDFKHLEDKVVGKLPTWNEKIFIAADRTWFVKSVITSHAIYHPEPLIVPRALSASQLHQQIGEGFLQSAKDKTT